MKIELPSFLEPSLSKIENISFCNYIQKEPQFKNEVYVRNNILIFVRRGTKILHLEDKTLKVDKDSILFLRSGNYLMTEVLEEFYEAILFLYKDELLLDFIKKYDIKFEEKDLEELKIFKIDNSDELTSLINTTSKYFFKRY